MTTYIERPILVREATQTPTFGLVLAVFINYYVKA